MSAELREGVRACHAYTIALFGARAVCDPAVAALRQDERLEEAGLAYRQGPGDFVRLIGRQRDLTAAVVFWPAGDTAGLLHLVAELRARQANPLLPVLVRGIGPLETPARRTLEDYGIYGALCRPDADIAGLGDDLVAAIRAMREKQALVELSEFVVTGAASLADLAAAALHFLHRHGVGERGGLFCFRRPTSNPVWLAVVGTGRYGAVNCLPVDKLAAPLREALTAGLAAGCARYDEDSIFLPVPTPAGSAACVYLERESPPLPWHRVMIHTFGQRLAGAIDQVLLRSHLERVHHATIATLATLAEYRDVDTGNHVSRVARLTTEVAALLDNPDVDAQDAPLVRHIGQASVLHDIGKVGIPDRVLLKTGPLDAEERRAIEQHAALGEEILLKAAKISDTPALMRLAADIARSHHEKFDGSGYPDGLAGGAIPLAARIVAVVDVFDALTGERPYKQPWPEEKAIDLICEQSGRHFDPRVVEAFLAVVERKRVAPSVTWSDDFSVGHAGIDEDHKKLFAILGQLWTAREGASRQIVEMALDDLTYYTSAHFSREEEYMQAIGYPQFREHRAAHEGFADRIESLRWEYLYGLRNDIHTELLHYLGEWLICHIADADAQYARFLAAPAAAS